MRSRSWSTSRTPASFQNGATCTTTCSATRSSASAASRACWRWRPPAWTATPRCPRSCATTRHEVGARKNSAQSQITNHRSRMPVYTAEWVLPMTGEPMRRASISIENGRIATVDDAPAAGAADLGDVAIIPALVNAHTHLELSYLRGRVPRTGKFLDWIRTIMAARRRDPDPADPDIRHAAPAAIAEARASGTGLLGDISNTLVTAPLLRAASLPAQIFYELLRFNAADAESMTREARAKADAAADPAGDVRVSLAPHAPYSVSPALFAAIRTDLDAHAGQVTSVHLGESPEETEFIRRGSGPWRG